ncbi:MAG: hypothetical protein K9N46_10655 [Candidatus Marinimicrobia bacterium]|nr:hypothetical protein [Candidatus Neomarinimicrobiota bacterium]MCF7829160.1 hypothetical protein [Candidatus Neomarinimicrobiota bacterium]MCF7881187.1 hypothetical protein [Candidatus Neomarinimicrobiota bacterium]
MRRIIQQMQRISAGIFLLLFPMLAFTAPTGFGGMAYSLFQDEVEWEMIQSSRENMIETNNLNSALHRISVQVRAKSALSSFYSPVSEGAMNLFIAQVEDDMVARNHGNSMDEALIFDALQSVTKSLKNGHEENPGYGNRVLYDSEIQLLLYEVEEKMVKEAHQQYFENSIIDRALRELATSQRSAENDDTSLTQYEEAEVPQKSLRFHR